MKIWQVIILIMIVIRVVMFTYSYFCNLRKLKYKKYSKYYIKHEWIFIIIMIMFFVEIFLFNYFVYRIGELANKCNNFIYDVANDLTHKICKKIENNKKIIENKEIEK